MQTANMEFVLAAAARADEYQGADRKFAQAAADSVEVGVLVPSIFKANLTAAGFGVVEDVAALSEYGFASLGTLKRVIVADKSGAIIAMGAAGDHKEALAHAALGWFREHPLDELDAPAGFATAPVAPPTHSPTN